MNASIHPVRDLPLLGEAGPNVRMRPAVVETLFREHNQSLVRFLANRLSSVAEATEVAQEAYVRLLQLDQPRAIGFLRAFLFKTASNIATDRLRRRRVARAANVTDPFDFDVDRLSPEVHASSAEELEIVSNCLRDMPARCRDAVLLSRVDGKGSNEIASELGVSTRMVRKYLTEALVLIRGCLEAVPTERRSNRDVKGYGHQ